MQFELTGKVSTVLPEQRFNGKNGEVVKNSFVIEWQENGYTQKLCVEVMGGDKWDKMKNAAVAGNNVMCKCSVSSREYQGRWFTSCQCFYCVNTDNSKPQVQQASEQTQAPQAQNSADNDVPF